MINIENTIKFMMKDIDKYLDDITLNAITVDSKTILKLEDMSSKNISPYLKKILGTLIKIEIEHIPDFDFSKIQSLENSKSFKHLPAKSKTPVATETCIRGERKCLTQKNLRQKMSPTGKRIFNI